MTKQFLFLKLGRALTQTIESFDLRLLFVSKSLHRIIHNYVFADELQETLNQAVTKAGEAINLDEDDLEILLLSLEGARMIVQEKGFVSPKQFDRYMTAKQFKVKERMITYYFNKAQDLVADTILIGIDTLSSKMCL